MWRTQRQFCCFHRVRAAACSCAKSRRGAVMPSPPFSPPPLLVKPCGSRVGSEGPVELPRWVWSIAGFRCCVTLSRAGVLFFRVSAASAPRDGAGFARRGALPSRRRALERAVRRVQWPLALQHPQMWRRGRSQMQLASVWWCGDRRACPANGSVVAPRHPALAPSSVIAVAHCSRRRRFPACQRKGTAVSTNQSSDGRPRFRPKQYCLGGLARNCSKLAHGWQKLLAHPASPFARALASTICRGWERGCTSAFHNSNLDALHVLRM